MYRIELRQFMNSGQDEVEFFNLEEDKSKLMTIEELFDNYTDDYHKLLKEIKTMKILLERKNKWAREIHIRTSKSGLSFSEEGKKSNIVLTAPKKIKIVNEFQLPELLRIYKLKSNSNGELVEIFKDIIPFLEKYHNRSTISGEFNVSHDDNKSFLFCEGETTPILTKGFSDIDDTWVGAYQKNNIKKRVYVKR